jgi:ribosome-associated translation inhibitor RaiA
MQHNLKLTNVESSDALEQYLREKLVYIHKFVKQGEQAVRADVELGRSSHHHRHGGEVYAAEINLHLNGRRLYARDASGRMQTLPGTGVPSS